MSSSESRRRKQLEKKKKKRNDKRHQIVVKRNAGMAEQLAMRAKAPVHECLVTSDVGMNGLIQLVISRKSASGEIAFALFLIDCLCMGVKDCFSRILPVSRYHDFKDEMRAKGRILTAIDPPSARRVVEDAVAYASSLGIRPHADFRAARMILGDIDPGQATRIFEMGRDGKPFFMSGPFQSPAECQMIIAKLTAVCGADGFHYVIAAHQQPTMLSGESFDELSFGDGDDYDDGNGFEEEDDEVEENTSQLRIEERQV